jgi:hypothetical protein
VKLAHDGSLAPVRGFSRRNDHTRVPLPGIAYVSHDGLLVRSSLAHAHLPGSGDPPKIGPQWQVTVSRFAGGDPTKRCKVTDDDLHRVIDCFAMPAFDEDNHHPGIARHLWCPVDEQYRNACECKLTEVTVVEDDGYTWTTENDDCRGCEYERRFGLACTIHREKNPDGDNV